MEHNIEVDATQPKYNCCFYSSFIFLVNSLVAFYFGYMFY